MRPSIFKIKEFKFCLGVTVAVMLLSVPQAHAMEYSTEELNFIVAEEVDFLLENPVEGISTEEVEMELYASPDNKWNMGLGAANRETRSKHEARDSRNIDKAPKVKVLNFKYKFDSEK